jgi:glycosyltransferase involved in cell wall biosynthesis
MPPVINKISLITVTYNAESYLEQCIQSVLSQTYPHFEYIIIDGGSTDSTLEIINTYKPYVTAFISEPDNGIYDAMNKGVSLSKGEIIGMLNADDFFPTDDILASIAAAFEEESTQIVYGNLWYVHPKSTNKVIRKWISKDFTPSLLQFGWMPPHPTFYVRKELFERYGGYDLSFKSASDYEFMLRLMHKFKLRSKYIDKLLVVMRTGGVSNRSVRNRLWANWNDFRAMKANGLGWPLLAVVLKPLRKISQYF